ncbi:salicylate hydroxylase [Raineyella antarctica]|uniref:Salicylate hydroxylase n=1 Tax=Raineyella antarctica TaxID=1577474 RepID=A0A1G6IB20_9ACTN|nr:FAD-dependent monooxygenase [Raineyella antarctica]SDC03620.1 salicylate hydroxylase [Raineyella antarctica]
MKDLRIAIVGAGIGGLALALALREKGIECTLYEAASELREVGAAVGLSAASTRYFIDRLGLGGPLEERWFEVQALIYRDGRDGRKIAEHRFDYRARYGAPWVGIHRVDLQVVLTGAVGMDAIKLNKRLVDIDDSGNEAVLHFTDGTSATADLVIGADGARSTVRRLLLGYDDALYSGASAFRGIVPPEQMPSMPDPEAIQFWMGPGRHCLHYPINSEGDHNFFLVERNPSPWPHKGWIAPTNDEEKLASFGDWAPAIVEMVSAVSSTERWALFHRPPLSRWSKGRVTLLGDAAHAMVPHHGQGANTSIEDAIVLAEQLAAGTDLDAARAEYERLRRGRTRKIQYASITNADVLHLPDGPRADERNARLADPSAWDRHLDWIHGFRPGEEEPSAIQGGTWL